jgi:isopentenyl-diphosphate delta-isomerase
VAQRDSERRKRDHLELCASDRVAYRSKTTLLEQVELLHRALPEIDFDEIDLSVELAGKRLDAPLWISAMTGGAEGAARLNRSLAELAAERGLGFCLGSMRPMLTDPARGEDFQVRGIAPEILVLGNVGATELVRGGVRPVIDALAAVDADGLTVHLNPVMELIQPGGDTDFKGAVAAIAALVEEAGELAVVVKETGCGLSFSDLVLLRDAGVVRVEVAGSGGTSWIGVETLRASGRKQRLGEMLWDWGVPTAVTTAWAVELGFEVVASGGIRSGLDIARALALGARLAGVAAPLIRADADGGTAAIGELLDDLTEGLRHVMLACGAATPIELATQPRVIGAELARWIEAGRAGGRP